jgi:hypothetical protein
MTTIDLNGLRIEHVDGSDLVNIVASSPISININVLMDELFSLLPNENGEAKQTRSHSSRWQNILPVESYQRSQTA